MHADETSETSSVFPIWASERAERAADRTPGVRAKWFAAAVFLVCVLAAFFNLGGHKSFGSHEGVAVAPAREMLVSGDWVVPRIGGEPRLRKPPLGYWVIAASAAVWGQVDEWSARFPAAFSSLLLSGLLGWWGMRWYGRAAGIVAALVQGTSGYVLIYARKAEVDMLLCLVTTLAMFLIGTQPANERGKASFSRWCGVFALLAVSWLGKFHYGTAMVLCPFVVYCFVQRHPARLWSLVNPPGLLLLASAAVLWPYLVLQRVPQAWDVWHEQTVGRVVGEVGQEPIWFYLPQIVTLMMPWTPIAFVAARHSWQRARREADPRERFLWVWFLTDLAIVSASAGKHPHYINVALPVFSLMCGNWWSLGLSRIYRGESWNRPACWRWLSVVGLLGCAAAGLALSLRFPYLQLPIVSVCGILALGNSLVMFLLIRERPRAAGYGVLAVFALCYIGVMGWIVPGQDHRSLSKRFVERVRESLPRDREVCAYKMDLTAVEFYLGDPVCRVTDRARLQSYLDAHAQALVVAFEPAVEELQQAGQVRPLMVMQSGDDEPEPRHPRLMLVEVTRQPDLTRTARSPRPRRRLH